MEGQKNNDSIQLITVGLTL